jgi:hypothetical protein
MLPKKDRYTVLILSRLLQKTSWDIYSEWKNMPSGRIGSDKEDETNGKGYLGGGIKENGF